MRTSHPPRLAVYGTLAVGQPNHHQLDGLTGRWIDGHVRGRLVRAGWGADLGYPALITGEDGGDVVVHVFESSDLAAHWSRLDDFEGPGYERVTVSVSTAEGSLAADIYVLAGSAPHQAG